MPRLKPTEKDKREAAAVSAVTRCALEKNLGTGIEIAQHLGMSPGNYSRIKNRSFMGMSLQEFSRVARKLEISDFELCAIVGIPFSGKRN